MNVLLRKNREVSPKKKAFQSGFTLIELITVIVILSILATIGTNFVVQATESYQSTQTRALLVNTARQAIERMTRQLRGALPYSARIVNAGQCIEFMPIVGGGNYIDGNVATSFADPVPDLSNGAPARNQISVSPHTLTTDFGVAAHVTIGALSANEIYVSPYVSRAAYNSASTSTLLQLNTAKQWQRNSINKRFYLLADPQAFCLVGNELRFYQDIPVTSAAVNLTSVGSIIARNVASANPFVLQNGSENRNTHVTISLDFSSGGETLNYTQGVFIRNVP